MLYTTKVENSQSNNNTKRVNNEKNQTTHIETTKANNVNESKVIEQSNPQEPQNERPQAVNSNTKPYKPNLTFEKVFFQNQKLLLPQLEKAIAKNSMSDFKNFLTNIGYKEPVSYIDINNTLKIALWDRKDILQKFTEIPEVKKELAEYQAQQENEKTRNTEFSKNETENIFSSNIKSFSISDLNTKNFTIKELKNIFSSAFKNYDKLNEKTQQLLNVKENFLNRAIKNFSLDYSKNYEELKNFSDKVSEKLNIVQNEVTANEISEMSVSREISKDLNTLLNNADFVTNLKDVVYYQIPININENSTNAELFIFKNKKKQKNSKLSSAVLSLDLAFLGHFEAYITKNERNISCQFKTENKNIEKLITSKITELKNLLQNYNFNLQQVSFKELDEKFSLLSKEPKLTDNEQKKTSFVFDRTT